MELGKLKSRLKTATRGHKLLKDKTDEMIRRFSEIIREDKALRDSLETEISLTLKKFSLARTLASKSDVELAFAMPAVSVEIDCDVKTVMNVPVPKLTLNKSENKGKYPYSFGFLTEEADVAVDAAGALIEKMVKLAELEKATAMLAEEIEKLCGNYLSFYDAAAPIVTADSIDFDKVFSASRYDRGGEDDYIHCPFNKEEYEHFINELINAESAVVHDFDVYEGCMPIEKLAKRGLDAPRFGPMKPVGLVNPKTGHRPWACVQLRRENSQGTMFNLVGFQTNLKFGEQKRVFSMISGLENAEFVRYGVMHRNSFINSPKLLNADYSMRTCPNIFFAGQITGVEGYMESASSGILAGINAVRYAEGKEPLILSQFTMMGALSRYISDETVESFQPMGANFGILPPIEPKIRDKKERYAALAKRALNSLN